MLKVVSEDAFQKFFQIRQKRIGYYFGGTTAINWKAEF
jgi:hypothetical protein